MQETKMRTLEFSGAKTGIRLDTSTWAAVDWLAEQRGVKWPAWVRTAIGNSSPHNLTAAVRTAVMDALLAATIFPDRAEQLAAMEANPLVSNNAAMNDKQFQGFMSAATVQGESDFGGFKVIFGFDNTGADFLAARNGLRDGLHFVTTPNGCMMDLDHEDAEVLNGLSKLAGIPSSKIAGKQYQASLYENSVLYDWLERQPESARHNLMQILLANYGKGGFIAGIKQIDPRFEEPTSDITDAL